MSTALILGFFPAYALPAIDLGMSLDPGYHSSLYPLSYLAASFYGGLAGTAVIVAFIHRTESGREIIAPSRSLDLGNLLWAFAILLAYFGWTEYLVVWMGNLPDEVAHHLQRWRAWPWTMLAWTALSCACAVPFVALFNRALKKNALWLGGVGGISLLGGLLLRFLDALPSLPVTASPLAFFIGAGVSIGFMGLFGLSYLWLLRRVPAFPIADPLFMEALELREYPV